MDVSVPNQAGADRAGAATPREALERHPLNVRQWALVALLTLALVLDGLDVKILSFAAPLILDEWAISKAAFGPVLAAALLGMAIGAGFGGWCGDRWGRRVVVVWSLALFGVTTIMAGLAQGVVSMTALRFLSGLGFGAVTPNAYALASEWLPSRAKPLAVGLITIGSPVGGSIGALVALGLLPIVGWQGCFIIAGGVTLALAVASIWLPESFAYLVGRGRAAAAAHQWRRIFPGDATPPDFDRCHVLPTAEAGPAGLPARRSVWRRDLMRINGGSALCFFSTQFVNYAIATWATVIFTTAGMPLGDAIVGGFAYNVLAVVFGLLTGPVLRLTGSAALLLIEGLALAVLVGVMMYLLHGGVADSAAGQLMLLGAFSLSGGISGSLITVAAAVASVGYPDEMRATGIGLGVMAGRVGGIASIVAGGQLLTLGGDDSTALLALLGVLALSVTASALVIDRHLPPSRRRETGRGAPA